MADRQQRMVDRSEPQARDDEERKLPVGGEVGHQPLGVVHRPARGDEEAPGAVREDEVEKFKEFLDTISPDDFKAT